MLFILRFTDKPGLASVRQDHLSAHIEWLAEHQEVIKVAGSLRLDLETVPLGALWIVEAASKLEVESVFQSDPFWRNGLRQSVEILHWSKAFPDLQVAV